MILRVNSRSVVGDAKFDAVLSGCGSDGNPNGVGIAAVIDSIAQQVTKDLRQDRLADEKVRIRTNQGQTPIRESDIFGNRVNGIAGIAGFCRVILTRVISLS